jgi:hypothetical protein
MHYKAVQVPLLVSSGFLIIVDSAVSNVQMLEVAVNKPTAVAVYGQCQQTWVM